MKGRALKKLPFEYEDVHSLLTLLSKASDAATPRLTLNSLKTLTLGDAFFLNPSPPTSTILSQAFEEERRRIIPTYDTLGSTRTERIGNLWKLVENHCVYKWLSNDPNWVKAWRVFKSKQSQRRPTNYTNDMADFSFVSAVGIQCAIDALGGRKSSGFPNATKRREIQTAILCLREIKSASVGLLEWSEENRLLSLLDKLNAQLGSISRKPRQDSTAYGRKFIDVVVCMLLAHFQEASPKIVVHLCAVIGYIADERTITGHVSSARRRAQKRIDAVPQKAG